MGGISAVGEHFSRTQQKWACVQFIAEVSLIANCKPTDLKLALTLIADLQTAKITKPKMIFFIRLIRL
jgi:hypothetical protein